MITFKQATELPATDPYNLRAVQMLAVRVAELSGIDQQLVRAVCHQESTWRSWAIRFEPGFYSTYVIGKVKQLPMRTESVSCATSWGLMQVMGLVARELGLPARLHVSVMCDPRLGLYYGVRKLAQCLEMVTVKSGTVNDAVVRRALLRYNGGGAPEYDDLVLAHCPHYSDPSKVHDVFADPGARKQLPWPGGDK